MTRSKIARLKRAVYRELTRDVKHDKQGKANLHQEMSDYIKNNPWYTKLILD